jgi:DNA-binding transcriptional LysR family regulator
VLVAAPGLVAALGAPATPADLPRFPTLSHTDAPGQDRWTLRDAEGREAVVLHEPRLASSSLPILRRAAVDGLGIAKLPEYGCRELLEAGALVPILPDWTAPQGILHLVFTHRRGLLPSVRAVIDFAAEVFSPRSVAWRAVAAP